jgi:biopolymer transport protein ExbD
MQAMIIITLVILDCYLLIRIFDYVWQFILLNLPQKEKVEPEKKDKPLSPINVNHDGKYSLINAKELVGENVEKVKINA